MNLEESAEALYEHAPCALLSTRPDGTILRVNQTFLDWLAAPRSEITNGVRFQSLLTIGSRMYYETHYAPLLQIQGFVNEIALEVRRRDGTTRPVVASARQVRSDSGEVQAVRIALFDSSDRRQYERELLIARRRAEDAAASLAEADRRKNDFIAVLAHELRNPLAPIRSVAEIFRRAEHANSAVGNAATVLQRQVGQMSRLVEDLLDVSRIGQDKLSMNLVPADLVSIVREAVETSLPLLRDAGVTLEMALPDQPVGVLADAQRLMQVIVNVLNNAAKFTPPGGVVALTLATAGDRSQLRIRDNGIGIDPAKLPDIFDMFMQADGMSERRGGLGIGLSLARSLVERHGGSITARSEGLGTGTEFAIDLPGIAQTGAAEATSPAARLATAANTSRRVLVVDDNRDAAQMIALLLEMSGHDVRRAHDGAEVLPAYENFHPDVVLLDIGLPLINGYEVGKQIRQRYGDEATLVAVTGYGEEDDRRKSLDAGFNHHLVKPVDHDALLALLSP